MAASRTAAFSAGFCRACARQDASTSSAARPGRCFRRRAAAAAAAAATAAAALTVTALPATAQAKGVLSTNTLFRRYVVTDGDAVLRYALPLPAERAGEDMPPIRRIQQLLEQLGIDVRARGAAGTFAARSSLARLRGTLDTERLDVLLGVPASKRAAVGDDLARLDRLVAALDAEITGGEAGSTPFPPQVMAVQGVLRDALAPRTAPLVFDPAEVDGLRRDALDIVADIENTMAAGEAFPYRVPRRYESLPRLLGRATLDLRIVRAGGAGWTSPDGVPDGPREESLRVVLDGFSAPLTTGNFVDLVRTGRYNGARVEAGEKGLYVQLGGKPDNSTKRRTVPMEILVEGDRIPLYGSTLDDLGVADLQPALPVTAYGALAMVHSLEDCNDASDQFLITLINPRSYTARSPGGSALTGNLAAFGFVTDGKHLLPQLRPGDVVKSAKVVSGEENFRASG